MGRALGIAGLGVSAMLVALSAGFALAVLGLSIEAGLWFGLHLHGHLGPCGAVDWSAASATEPPGAGAGCLRTPFTWSSFGAEVGIGALLSLAWWFGWSRLGSRVGFGAKPVLAAWFALLTVLCTAYVWRSITSWY